MADNHGLYMKLCLVSPIFFRNGKVFSKKHRHKVGLFAITVCASTSLIWKIFIIANAKCSFLDASLEVVSNSNKLLSMLILERILTFVTFWETFALRCENKILSTNFRLWTKAKVCVIWNRNIVRENILFTYISLSKLLRRDDRKCTWTAADDVFSE